MSSHIASRLAAAGLLLVASCQFANAAPEQVTFASGPDKVTVVELFTSEGCSSCPPAERWLSRFRTRPDLWKGVIPLAFHVDYWNDLGWVDKFSEHQFSTRQQSYEETGHVGTVYTPGIVIDGAEWRKFFNPFTRYSPLPKPTSRPGKMRLTRSGDTVTVQFHSTLPLVANVAFLGMGIQRRIGSGENAGKLLTEDFVVLSLTRQKGQDTWTFSTLKAPKGTVAIAAWVAAPRDPTPIQAVGGQLR